MFIINKYRTWKLKPCENDHVNFIFVFMLFTEILFVIYYNDTSYVHVFMSMSNYRHDQNV